MSDTRARPRFHAWRQQDRALRDRRGGEPRQLRSGEGRASLPEALRAQVSVRAPMRMESAEDQRRRFPPYPVYEQSGVRWLGQIPAHWVVRRLGQLGVFFKGNGGTKEDEVFDGVPCVRYGDLYTSHQFFIHATRRRIAPHRARAYTPIEYGDLLFAASGETFEEIGKSAVSLIKSEARCGGDVVVFRPSVPIEPRFLGYASDCYSAAAQKALMGTGSIIKHIDAGQLKYLAIALPPGSEQLAIADALDRETEKIDALIAKQEQLIGLLHESRTALITRSVTVGLHPTVPARATKSAQFPEIPDGWHMRKLRRLITRVRRPVLVDLEAQYREIGTRSWGKGIFHKEPLRGAQLEDKSVFCVRPGDLILNIVFAWEGAAAVASEREAGMIASHRFPTFRHAADLVDLDYLLMLLQSEQGRALMGLNSPGAAGRNRTIRLSSFLSEEIPIPPPRVQREIVQAFRAQEELLSAAEAKARALVDRLEELRIALVSAAVTGQIDVRTLATA